MRWLGTKSDQMIGHGGRSEGRHEHRDAHSLWMQERQHEVGMSTDMSAGINIDMSIDMNVAMGICMNVNMHRHQCMHGHQM